MKQGNKKKGDLGEKMAAEYLRKIGCLILAQNVRNRAGEIDLIAMEQEYLVFVEVKSRTSQDFGLPNEAVDIRKQRKIYAASGLYLQQKGCYDIDVRYDVIEVYLSSDGQHLQHIEHIRDAFSWSEF